MSLSVVDGELLSRPQRAGKAGVVTHVETEASEQKQAEISRDRRQGRPRNPARRVRVLLGCEVERETAPAVPRRACTVSLKSPARRMVVRCTGLVT
jgi:hypothetical protein